MNNYYYAKMIVYFVILITLFIQACAPKTDSVSSYSNLDFNTLSNQDSLYRVALRNRDELLLKQIIRNNSDNLMGALAACRLIDWNMVDGNLPSSAIQEVRFQGLKLKTVDYANAIDVVFLKPGLRITVFNDNEIYRYSDPQVGLHMGQDKYTPISFGALHILANKDHYELQGENIIIIAPNQREAKLAYDTYNRLVVILADFGESLGYPSINEAFSKLIWGRNLLGNKLIIFIYDKQFFKIHYDLKSVNRSTASSGVIYIDSKDIDSDELVRIFIHELSHVFFNGTRVNWLHSHNRWLDEGFAQWVTISYKMLGGLKNPQEPYFQRKMDEIIMETRKKSYNILKEKGITHISLESINRAWKSSRGRHGSSSSYTLSKSLVTYIIDKYGIDILLTLIKEISNKGGDLTETLLKDVIEMDYAEIEQGWNQWINELANK